MIRTLMTTTAIAVLLSSGAMAQDATTTAPATTAMPADDILAKGFVATDSDNLASEIIGKQVYSSAAADAEHIGDINNLVVGDDGAIEAVIIGVGGFLGMGEKNVAVSMAALQWVAAEDNTERYVLETTKEALNTAPAFEWADDNDAFTDFDEAQLTAEELIGTNVYGTNDEHIGAIGDLALNADGSIDAIVIDFGGFLGIGTKPVAVAYEDLNFLANTNQDRALVLPITRDQMDAAPAFNKDSYAAERDAQRVVVNAQS
jgi:sporulation protein YlmC with PRC-barrel domain